MNVFSKECNPPLSLSTVMFSTIPSPWLVGFGGLGGKENSLGLHQKLGGPGGVPGHVVPLSIQSASQWYVEWI